MRKLLFVFLLLILWATNPQNSFAQSYNYSSVYPYCYERMGVGYWSSQVYDPADLENPWQQIEYHPTSTWSPPNEQCWSGCEVDFGSYTITYSIFHIDAFYWGDSKSQPWTVSMQNNGGGSGTGSGSSLSDAQAAFESDWGGSLPHDLGIWEGTRDWEGECSTDDPSDPPPDEPSDPPPDDPPPDCDGSLICECINGLQAILDQILAVLNQILDALSAPDNQDCDLGSGGDPSSCPSDPPEEYPPGEEPPTMPELQPENPLQCAWSVLSEKFPFDVFGNFSETESQVCPNVTFFGKAFEFCFLLDAVRALKYPVIISFIIKVILSL